VIGAVVVAASLGGCSGGDGSSLTVDGLAETGSDCPVDLDGAVTAAGVEGDAGPVTAEVSTGSGEGGQDASALDQAGGVYVECTRPVGDGEVTAVVFASEHPGAISLLLPLLQHDLQLDMDDLPGIVERAQDADEGELIDTGGEGSAAVGRLGVDGAESAILYVSASSAPSAASPTQVRTIAEDLLDDL
jgi:hypothetical protein